MILYYCLRTKAGFVIDTVTFGDVDTASNANALTIVGFVLRLNKTQ